MSVGGSYCADYSKFVEVNEDMQLIELKALLDTSCHWEEIGAEEVPRERDWRPKPKRQARVFHSF